MTVSLSPCCIKEGSGNVEIRILGIELERFKRLNPDPAADLPPSILEAWSERHPSIKNPTARTASLAGVWLLWKSGVNASLCYTESGKPTLLSDTGTRAVSITHTDHYAFCAVATDADAKIDLSIGLDAEEIIGRSADRMTSIASRFFTARERSYLEKMPTEARFLEIWTKKEALVKCTGDGMRGLHAADTQQTSYSFSHFSQNNVRLSLAYSNGLIPPREIEMM